MQMHHVAAHECCKIFNPFLPLSRAAAGTLYNGDTASAGNGTANKGIDLQGFYEALIIINEGAIAAGAAITYNIKCADVNDVSDASATQVTDGVPANASAAFVDTDDNKTKLIRIRAQDVKRFLFVERVQTGAFAAVDSVVVMLTAAQKEPVTQDATIGGTVSVAFTHAS